MDQSATVPVVWTASGENKLRLVAGGWFHLSPKSNSSCLAAGCCEVCGQPPTCGQGGGNAWRFPRLVHRGPRWRGRGGGGAGAFGRGSPQPTVHKFTAPPCHGVRRPVPSPLPIGRGKPRPVFASRAPDADVADYTSQRTRQGCAFVRFHWPLGVGRPIRASQSPTSARRRCCHGSARVRPC